MYGLGGGPGQSPWDAAVVADEVDSGEAEGVEGSGEDDAVVAFYPVVEARKVLAVP